PAATTGTAGRISDRPPKNRRKGGGTGLQPDPPLTKFGQFLKIPGFPRLRANSRQTGYLSLTGEPDGPPARMGLSIVDLMTGLFAAFALVSGVLAVRQSG